MTLQSKKPIKKRKPGGRKMEFYLVTTKCGHVGKTSYVPITFPIKAENGREAARIARTFPRVKRNHWDAILKVEKVDEDEYLKQIVINNQDPYLHVSSKQEQKELVEDIESRMVEDNHQNEINKPTRKSKKPNLRFQKLKYFGSYDEYRYEYSAY